MRGDVNVREGFFWESAPTKATALTSEDAREASLRLESPGLPLYTFCSFSMVSFWCGSVQTYFHFWDCH